MGLAQVCMGSNLARISGLVGHSAGINSQARVNEGDGSLLNAVIRSLLKWVVDTLAESLWHE